MSFLWGHLYPRTVVSKNILFCVFVASVECLPAKETETEVKFLGRCRKEQINKISSDNIQISLSVAGFCLYFGL